MELVWTNEAERRIEEKRGVYSQNTPPTTREDKQKHTFNHFDFWTFEG